MFAEITGYLRQVEANYGAWLGGMVGAISGLAVEGLNWSRDRYLANEDRLKKISQRLEDLEKVPPPVTGGQVLVDPALFELLTASTTVGTVSSPYVTKGAGLDTGTASVLNLDTTDKQTVAMHRIRLAPNGTPTTGDQVTVTFPKPFSRIPQVDIRPETKAANQHLYAITSVSKTGYTIGTSGAPTASTILDFAVKVEPQT